MTTTHEEIYRDDRVVEGATLTVARLNQLRAVSHDGTSYTWSNGDMREAVGAIDALLARLSPPSPEATGKPNEGVAHPIVYPLGFDAVLPSLELLDQLQKNKEWYEQSAQSTHVFTGTAGNPNVPEGPDSSLAVAEGVKGETRRVYHSNYINIVDDGKHSWNRAAGGWSGPHPTYSDESYVNSGWLKLTAPAAASVLADFDMREVSNV